jgi:bifunctional enzyme CysN/CysC
LAERGLPATVPEAQAPAEPSVMWVREPELLRFVTVGSVDDGKSTLIGRLLYNCRAIPEDQMAALVRDSRRLNRGEIDLALLTDGLRAEREQAITIDVAYRSFATGRRRFIIADCPGHEQYTRNMVTGACGADLAVLLVDARHGLLTQSKRHAFLVSLLGIPHVVVAVNKMDLVGYAEAAFERIRADFDVFSARLRIPDLTYIPMCALRGDNVLESSRNMPWYKGAALLAHLEQVVVGSHRNLIDLRLPVQCVLRPSADFRGYAGQIASGVLRPQDEVMALPSGRRTRVAAIVTRSGQLAYAFAPQSVTVCMEDPIDLSRGDMLVHPKNVPQVSREVEAMLVWMAEESLFLHRPYLLKHTTRLVKGTVAEMHYRIEPDNLHRAEADTLRLNEIGRVSLHLYQPLCWDEYARNRATGSFILIDPASNATVGAGMLIDRARARTPLSRTARGDSGLHPPVPAPVLVTPEERAALLRQRPVTFWLTGLSGAGKSTIARLLERRLTDAGHACTVLDGDTVRQGLNRDLGFSPGDRTENIRRVAEVARLFNDAGVIVITALISPYRSDRAEARAIVGEGRFLEVFVDAPLAVCEGRDPKGLYRNARAGLLPDFTGISAPYEPPEAPDLHLKADTCAAAECVATLFHHLRELGVRNPEACPPGG